MSVWHWVLGGAAFVPLYAYGLYPLILAVIAWLKPRRMPPPQPDVWPVVSVTVPVYNEARIIRDKLKRMLAYDYPRERLQILVVSDASTDRTDDIVGEFAEQGVELIRLPQRGGKTAAENAALQYLVGEIVLNSDASVVAKPDALRRLVTWFGDPTVGVASGRDVSTASGDLEGNVGESGYVGYEMWVRRLETRAAGIIGASGCFYAIRRELHLHLVPEALSRDFAAPLVARAHGFRSVSDDSAVVGVPRTSSLRAEYRRKVRTLSRGMQTLFFHRRLMNPFRSGLFAWQLFSHKVVRWLVPWAGLVALVALAFLAQTTQWALGMLAITTVGCLIGLAGWLWPQEKPMPRVVALPAFLLVGNLAALHACINAMRGDMNPIWEPTRREPVAPHA